MHHADEARGWEVPVFTVVVTIPVWESAALRAARLRGGNPASADGVAIAASIASISELTANRTRGRTIAIGCTETTTSNLWTGCRAIQTCTAAIGNKSTGADRAFRQTTVACHARVQVRTMASVSTLVATYLICGNAGAIGTHADEGAVFIRAVTARGSTAIQTRNPADILDLRATGLWRAAKALTANLIRGASVVALATMVRIRVGIDTSAYTLLIKTAREQ